MTPPGAAAPRTAPESSDALEQGPEARRAERVPGAGGEQCLAFGEAHAQGLPLFLKLLPNQSDLPASESQKGGHVKEL